MASGTYILTTMDGKTFLSPVPPDRTTPEEIDGLPSKLPDKALRSTRSTSFHGCEFHSGLCCFCFPTLTGSVAFGDFNNDGRVDAIVTTQNSLPELLINHSPGNNHWLLGEIDRHTKQP